MHRTLGKYASALFLCAAALLPAAASAQSCTTPTAYYGTLMQIADLDGNGTQEAICNAYSEINVVSGTAATRYPLSNTYWTLAGVVDVDGLPGAEVVLQQGTQITILKHYQRTTTYVNNMGSAWTIGAFADVDGSGGKEIVVTDPTRLRIVYGGPGSVGDYWIGAASRVAAGAIADMDGNLGMEIPLESGSNLVVYGRYSGLQTIWITAGTNWKVCTDIANCASDMNGVAGAELLLALPSEVKVYSMKSGGLSSYWIGSQYATLENGVRPLDDRPGNDVAMARSDGMLLILHPAGGGLQTISGAGTFGTLWQLVGYANLDGVAGDEIRIRSLSNNRIYRVYPRTGSVVAE